MIIGFDGSRAFLKNRTGTENYAFQLLTHLAKIDHKNIYKIYLRPPATQGESLRGWPPNFQFSVLSIKYLWTQFGLAKQTFIDKLDVLFVPSHTLPVIRNPGLKTVITVHDLGSKYLPKMHQLKQQLYLKFMTDIQLKTANHIIAVSQATKSDIIHNIEIQPDKISVVYEGYDKDKFKVQNSKFKVASLPYFLFVGTIQPRKNLERLLKAYASFLNDFLEVRSEKLEFDSLKFRSLDQKVKKSKIQDQGYPTSHFKNSVPRFVLAGGKGWSSDEIYELPKKLGIEKYVKFLGYVPDEKLPALYCGAQALLFPSLFEGFGLPILEAMACGCPVLTSNISSMPEVTGKAALLVDPYSVNDIARGIKQIMDPKVKEKLINAGFTQAKKFSWEKAARDTLQILEKVISS
ncbi:hypothetical protein A2617_00725 [Candidatus Daviesbacteria bacterium RIFOXYD1_FULL_41_10]|uniref:Glycosyl transferase family 1 domain-containing protein n=3 Tax=Microgenomates group TaxID=1794810 RepID=A0A1F5N274_9BACT|nr:MAG: Glycosyl transferase group 1 [Candidatus Curtissbacteria bacterium GW2011_GWA1_41_11]KKS12649.1 MAG: Glycosyl transferase group 1 [Candidatus Daviesbacteria bacterium GW2011_GWB1_41_5]OGE71731.1 MAG: hypothetical protein A2617_00725 [Candidatus Daviesbacteria bacterium RIFOXYD1_FULL_41_10]